MKRAAGQWRRQFLNALYFWRIKLDGTEKKQSLQIRAKTPEKHSSFEGIDQRKFENQVSRFKK